MPTTTSAWLPQKQEKIDTEAIACYRQALRCRPEMAETYYNLGMALHNQLKHDEAIAAYRQAVRLQPDFAEAYSNLGMAFRDQGKLDEAIENCREALRLKPDLAEALTNLANALNNRREFAEAEAHYQDALRLKPDMAEAHFNRALQLLIQGNFVDGWPEYEWRWQAKGLRPKGTVTPDFGPRKWDGSDLQGRNILLHSEQGLGDTIHFARYAALLKRQGAGQVLLTCPPELVRLMTPVSRHRSGSPPNSRRRLRRRRLPAQRAAPAGDAVDRRYPGHRSLPRL